jgi:hypothetical protein
MHSPGLLQSIKEENMSIECYFSACPNHDIHSKYPHPDLYAGPFCSQNDCTAHQMDVIKFQAARECEFTRHPCGSQRCPGLSEMTLEQLKTAQDARRKADQALQDALKTLDRPAVKP